MKAIKLSYGLPYPKPTTTTKYASIFSAVWPVHFF